MAKVLVISYSGFSDQSANGKTLKALLNNHKSYELAQFYCGNEPYDFDFCENFFHINDKQMIKSFYSKNESRIHELKRDCSEKEQQSLDNCNNKNSFNKFKKFNYNFFVRMIREILWCVGPWGKREFYNWVKNFSPKVILFMVGEGWFLESLLLKTLKKFQIPVVLFNVEAYKIVDISKRKGIEKLYYVITKKYYKKLLKKSNYIIYNSEYLKEYYEKEYGDDLKKCIIYNSAKFENGFYQPNENNCAITYFGNLGVGRVPSLLKCADYISKINKSIILKVYGKTTSYEDGIKLYGHPNISYEGIVSPSELIEIKEKSDILLHVESFDENIAPKLKFAFSTKIAQYLSAGRCVFSYAPKETASTKYLIDNECAVVAYSDQMLEELLTRVLKDQKFRVDMANKALNVALRNHDIDNSSDYVEKIISEVIHEN